MADNPHAPFVQKTSNKGLWTANKPGDPWAGSKRNDEIWNAIYAERCEWLPIVHAWREAAIADGWACAPTYENEPVERAARLTRDGWVVQLISRASKDGGVSDMAVASIHAWGPDGAAIEVGQVYDFAAMQAAFRTCSQCGATDVDTQRYAFATRCCSTCGPPYQAALPSNWCD